MSCPRLHANWGFTGSEGPFGGIRTRILLQLQIALRYGGESHLIESVVYCDLVRRGFNVDMGVVPHSEQIEKGW